jgi:DNA-binding ferritin-like protein (Dps family)
MSNLLTKIIGDKKEWKAMEARANTLPAGDGKDIVAVLREVLELFETSAAHGENVLDVTGEDVAAFCHERLRGTTSYLDKWRASLTRDVATKLAE